jgi:hypothetical protein
MGASSSCCPVHLLYDDDDKDDHVPLAVHRRVPVANALVAATPIPPVREPSRGPSLSRSRPWGLPPRPSDPRPPLFRAPKSAPGGSWEDVFPSAVGRRGKFLSPLICLEELFLFLAALFFTASFLPSARPRPSLRPNQFAPRLRPPSHRPRRRGMHRGPTHQPLGY